mgnify:CR=1 FL=1
MPNNKNERKGKQTGELSAEERFRNFFSTSVIDLPEEMTHRDEPAPVEEKPKAGLLGKLFGHDKEETPAAAQPVLEIPTGEILLGADARPVQPGAGGHGAGAAHRRPCSGNADAARPPRSLSGPSRQSRCLHPRRLLPCSRHRKSPYRSQSRSPLQRPKSSQAKNAPEILLPQEELEQREMQQLKDMLNGMSGKAKPAPQPAKPVQAAPQQRCSPRLHSLRQSRKKPRQRLHKRPPRNCRRWCLPALRQTRKRCRKSLRKSRSSRCLAQQRTKSPLPASRKKRIL